MLQFFIKIAVLPIFQKLVYADPLKFSSQKPTTYSRDKTSWSLPITLKIRCSLSSFDLSRRTHQNATHLSLVSSRIILRKIQLGTSQIGMPLEKVEDLNEIYEKIDSSIGMRFVIWMDSSLLIKHHMEISKKCMRRLSQPACATLCFVFVSKNSTESDRSSESFENLRKTLPDVFLHRMFLDTTKDPIPSFYESFVNMPRYISLSSRSLLAPNSLSESVKLRHQTDVHYLLSEAGRCTFLSPAFAKELHPIITRYFDIMSSEDHPEVKLENDGCRWSMEMRTSLGSYKPLLTHIHKSNLQHSLILSQVRIFGPSEAFCQINLLFRHDAFSPIKSEQSVPPIILKSYEPQLFKDEHTEAPAAEDMRWESEGA